LDIHCKYCGEPWDHAELHDMPTPESLSKNGQPLPYKEAAALFSKLGCGAFQTNFGENNPTMCRASMVDADAAAWAEASHILSDDPDDWLQF
jgi:hypothetical protein|tara:strand:+ start:855 stop:1130 length:276 start_codon:yes stop_codon:yes gene_type:complete